MFGSLTAALHSLPRTIKAIGGLQGHSPSDQAPATKAYELAKGQPEILELLGLPRAEFDHGRGELSLNPFDPFVAFCC